MMQKFPKSTRPNILFIIADDHQFDAIGAVGHPVVRTPVIDSLVQRGTLFSRAANMGSLMPAICSPARACLLTGYNPFQANTDPVPGGGDVDFVEIPASMKTLPQLLGEAGYETFFSGKWHNDRSSFLRSFEKADNIFHGGMCDHDKVPVRDRDEFLCDDPPEIADGFSSELFCASAAKFLKQRDPARPFFAWVALTSPHDPRMPPERFRALYDEASIPLPPAFAPEPAFDNGELHIRDERLAAKPLTPAVIREHLADYYGMISHHDHEIGKVLATLRATGAEENTIVVYVGDHGLALGRHGLLGKQNLYEHSVRVPLVMAGPGIPEGARAPGLVYSLDLFATLLELAGLTVPRGVESRSLLPQLENPDRPARDELFCLYKDCQRSIRNERWKLIEYRVAGRRRSELFDLAGDPFEEKNLSAAPSASAVLKHLRRRLVEWQAGLGDNCMTVETDAETVPKRP